MAASSHQPFQQHIQELRRRLTFVVVILLAGAGAGYAFHGLLIQWFSRPLHQSLYYTAPSGALQFTMQICMLVGVVTALPVAVYQVVRFIEPAVHRHDHTRLNAWRVARFVVFSYGLALLGAAFAYFFVLPTALHFFAGFSSNGVRSFITADKYFSFAANCIGVFALIFQVPIIMLFINRIKPLQPKKLRRLRKWVIIASFLVALILPFAYDPLSQVLMALPMIFLYELSIILIAVANRQTRTSPINRPAASQPKPQPVPAAPQTALASRRLVPPQPAYTAPAAMPSAPSLPPRRRHDGQFTYRPRPVVASTSRWPVSASHISTQPLAPLPPRRLVDPLIS